MENKSIKKGKVMPGDELAVIEEFESGKGTYEIKGQIRASVLGETTVDNKKKFIQINESIKRSRLPKENDQVFISYFIMFILFRIFDIVKPYPVSYYDKNFKNSFGVIMDDVCAGLYVVAVLVLYMVITS